MFWIFSELLIIRAIMKFKCQLSALIDIGSTKLILLRSYSSALEKFTEAGQSQRQKCASLKNVFNVLKSNEPDFNVVGKEEYLESRQRLKRSSNERYRHTPKGPIMLCMAQDRSFRAKLFRNIHTGSVKNSHFNASYYAH